MSKIMSREIAVQVSAFEADDGGDFEMYGDYHVLVDVSVDENAATAEHFFIPNIKSREEADTMVRELATQLRTHLGEFRPDFSGFEQRFSTRTWAGQVVNLAGDRVKVIRVPPEDEAEMEAEIERLRNKDNQPMTGKMSNHISDEERELMAAERAAEQRNEDQGEDDPGDRYEDIPF